jgi:ADP-ribose pyrophosphatase YjhB (NUDIX family)
MPTILEKSNFVNVIASVAIREGFRYLLVKEAKKEVQGLWNFPTGKVEYGESLIKAAEREVKEETGFECKIVGISGINYFYWNDMPGFTVRFNFIGERVSKMAESLAKDVLGISWFTIKEIQEMDAKKQLRSKTTVSQYKELIKGLVFPLSILSEP